MVSKNQFLIILVLWAPVVLVAGSRRNPVPISNKVNYRDEGEWQEYKWLFGKSYANAKLDSLHRTIFVRRQDIFKTLNDRCKSEQVYLWTKSSDSLRSTWSSYVEPTVKIFINNFDMKHQRYYDDPEEQKLRHQLIELFLDQRRLLRNCCKLSLSQLLNYADETIDRTLDEIQAMGKRDDRLNRIEYCQNDHGGPL